MSDPEHRHGWAGCDEAGFALHLVDKVWSEPDERGAQQLVSSRWERCPCGQRLAASVPLADVLAAIDAAESSPRRDITSVGAAVHDALAATRDAIKALTD